MNATLLKIIGVCEAFQNADIEGHTEESIISDAERTIKLIIRIASEGLKENPVDGTKEAFVEIAKTLGADSVTVTATGRCKACGDFISPHVEFCLQCMGENGSKS